MGGLGNQMFQYACGRAVAHRLNARLYLDLSWFKDGERMFLLDAFPNVSHSLYAQKTKFKKIMQRMGLCTPIPTVAEPYYSYWSEIENIRSSVRLLGYWQNERYFFDVSSVIKQDFIFPNFSCSKAENIATKIRTCVSSVGIHIRRGDYVENHITNCFHGICSMEYYEKALQVIAGNKKATMELYIFSDDFEWVKNNFDTHGYPSVFVDISHHKDAAYHDMHLMSLCQHHIIANSSFSWWGAWLSGKNGRVVAPKLWFADEVMKKYNPSVMSWVAI